ncbi:MAG: outer membrane protein assembly factor BamA [Candidatus Puniceispirillaceae bacterium]
MRCAKRIQKFLIIFAFLGMSASANLATAQTTTTIDEILVTGNQRVSTATILSYLPIGIGDRVKANSLNSAVENLFDTKLFEDVTISLNGTSLEIEVLENPIVNRINIEGNDILKDESLLAELNIQPRRIYTDQLAIEATQKLLSIYRLSGRYAAQIEPKLIKLDNNRVDLVFEVDEGPLIKIASIKFSGNEAFSDRALRQVISSRVERWWAFLSRSDKYDEARLDFDIRLLRQFYLTRGYADIDVSRAQGGLLPDRSGFAVSFELTEGVRYKNGSVSITSEIEGVDEADLIDEIPLDQGDWYDVRYMEQGLLNVTNKLGTLGYSFVNVTPNIVTNPETGILDVEINIGSARKNYIERIEIVDNNRTLDKVIRREMQLVEGDAYNQLKLDNSVRDIRNLGFFSRVEVANFRGSADDQTVTEISVEEQSTGDLQVGVGYSSIDKATFNFGVNERNFLGTGRKAEFNVGLSNKSTNIRLGLTEPYFLGRNMYASGGIFRDVRKENTYTAKSRGFDLGLGFDAANNIYHRFGYVLSENKTNAKSTKATSVSGEEGKTIISSAFSYTVGIDKRDNRFDPREGYNAQIKETYSGVGGDATYLKSEVMAGYYAPFNFNSIIFGAKIKAGTVDGLGNKVTQSSRFFLGGRTVRGFDGGGIGPRDKGNNASVGGNNYYAGTLEVVSDLGFTKDLGMRWTVYSDFGSLWGTDYPSGVKGANDSSMRTSAGFGLLWDTAIGPLSFYWADAIERKSYDRTRRFQFTIGTRL